MKPFSLYLTAFLALFFVSGCVDDDGVNPVDPTVELNVPTTYSFERDGASTVSFSGQSERIAMAEELISAMKDTEKTANELRDMFSNPTGVDPFEDPVLNASTKSIRADVAFGARTYAQDPVRTAAIRSDFNRWIFRQVEDVFPFWNQVAAPGQAGQIADEGSTRYVNEWGLEYDQAFAKGLVGAMMVDQINNNSLYDNIENPFRIRERNDSLVLFDGQNYTELEHRWDEAFGYLFGASTTPATPLADLEDADSFLNKYLGRVEGDEDYAGIATEIEEAFRTGRQAIVQRMYFERSSQAATIRNNLEKVIAVRAVYYLKQGELALRAQPVRRGTAFHDLSEGYGFIYSLRFINQPTSIGIPIDWYDRSEEYLAVLSNSENNGWWDIDPDILATLAQDVANATGINVDEAGN